MVWKPKALRTTYGGYSTSDAKQYYAPDLDPNAPVNIAAREYEAALGARAQSDSQEQYEANVEAKRKKLEKRSGKKVKKQPPVDFSRPDRHATATQTRDDKDDGWGKTAQASPPVQDKSDDGWGK